MSFSEKFEKKIHIIVTKEIAKLTPFIIQLIEEQTKKTSQPKNKPTRSFIKWNSIERYELREKFIAFTKSAANELQRTPRAIRDQMGKQFYNKENY